MCNNLKKNGKPKKMRGSELTEKVRNDYWYNFKQTADINCQQNIFK